MSAWRERIAGYAGVIFGLLLLSGLFVAAVLAMGDRPLPQAQGERLAPDDKTTSSGSAASEVIGERPDTGSLVIYECQRDGQRVLSDHVCGVDARARSVDVAGINTYTPVSPPTTLSATPERTIPNRPDTTARAPRSTVSAAAEKKPLGCEALEKEKDRINARMRRPYTAPEGERLRARLREISDRYWDLNCTGRRDRP